MISDEIAYGETYDLSVTVKDADGDLVTLDETYTAVYRFTNSRETGGTQVAAGSMTIADGAATASVDTGDEGWSPGIYYYDVRITDPDGNEYVSEMIQLAICNTQTQPA